MQGSILSKFRPTVGKSLSIVSLILLFFVTLMPPPLGWSAEEVDISQYVQITTSNERSTLNRVTRTLTSTADITITNISTQTIHLPLHAIVDIQGASYEDVEMPNALGGYLVGPYGKYYYEWTDAGVSTLALNFGKSPCEGHCICDWDKDGDVDGKDLALASLGDNLVPGESITFEVKFTYPEDIRFQYSLNVLGILHAPQGPIFRSTPPTTAIEGLWYYYQVVAEDLDGGPITLNLEESPSGLMFHEDNLLAWNPGPHQIGQHTVRIRATNQAGQYALQEYVLNVLEYNDKPVITSIPPKTAKVNQLYEYKIRAFDNQRQPISFVFLESPSGMTIEDTQTTDTGETEAFIRWIPSEPGTFFVSLEATDPEGSKDIQEYSIMVLDEDFVLTILSPQDSYQVSVGETLTFSLEANHPQATFSVYPQLPNSTLKPGTFSFTPVLSQEGSYFVVFEARLENRLAQKTVTIEVTGDNSPPQITQIEDQTIKEGETLILKVEAEDADNDPLQYSVVNLDLPNSYFDEFQHTFYFYPTYEQAGDYEVDFSVSDGKHIAYANVNIHVVDEPSPPRVIDLVIDPPQSPTFFQTQTISGSVFGDATELINRPPMLIVGLSPSSVHKGETKSINIKGFNTHFQQGVTTADFGKGIVVKDLDILSETEALATIEVSSEADIGIHRVKMTINGETIASVVGFTVEKAVNVISGEVKDRFTGQPIENALVTINGTGIHVFTGPDGHFTIMGVPEGQQSLLITVNNYQYQAVDIAVGSGESITLSDPIELKALTYTPSYPGQLPLATTVASILDRKIATSGEGMSLEEAKAVIRDTMIVVGGTQVGVLNESGKQLNPKVKGNGMLSLTPFGVEQHAKRLIQRRSTTLRELVWALNEGFSFVGGPLTMARVVTGLQSAVNKAWSDPANPESAMAIVLFNHGRTLNPAPPRITPDTTLNHFQTFLFIASFFVYNYEMIDISITRLLEERGIDYESLLVTHASATDNNTSDFAFSLGNNRTLCLTHTVLETLKGILSDFFSPRPAYADPPQGVVVTISTNDPFHRELGKGKTFEKVWKEIAGGAITEAVTAGIGGFISSIKANLIFTATIGGGTGGVQGALTGVLMGAAAAMQGFVSTLFQKVLLAWISAATFQALEPLPPIIESGYLDEQGNLIITFDRSNTELQRFNELMGYESIPLPTSDVMNNPETLDRVHQWGIKPEYFHYAYLLYKFPDSQCLSVGKGGGQYVPAKLTVVPDCKHNTSGASKEIYSRLFPMGDPRCKLQFVIPSSALTPGMNYFRIACIQYLRKSAYTLADLNYDGDGDGKPDLGVMFDHSAIQQSSAGEGYDTWTSLLPSFTPALGEWELEQVREIVKNDYFSRAFELDISSDDPMAIASYNLLKEHHNIDVLETNLEKYQKEFQQQQDEFFRKNGDRIKANKELHELLSSAQNPEDIKNPNSDLYNQAKQTLGIPASEPIPDGMYKDIVDIVDTKKQIIQLKTQYEYAQDAVRNMETFMSKDLKDFPEGVESKMSFKFYEDGIEKNYVVTFSTHQEAKAKISALKNAEMAKLEMANEVMDQKLSSLYKGYDDLLHKSVPDLTEFEYTRSKYMNKIDMVEKQLDHCTNEEARLKQTLFEKKEEPHKKYEADLSMAKVDAAFEVFGAINMIQEQLLVFLNSVSVLSSEFSHCFMIPYQTRSIDPFAIEPNPNIKLMNGIYSAEKRISSDNPHLGYIKLQYPSEMEAVIEKTVCGFPPEQLAVDSKGRLYTNNYNSNVRFGGRLFRFDPSADMKREYVGNVNYYSLLLQFGRPATPVAMAIGSFYDPSSGSLQEDLFIADIDYSASGGPKKRILRVPIHLLEENPDFDRNRMVGKEFVKSSDFKFTGPTDMEFDQENRIFLSDEDSIYVIWSHGETHQPVMTRIIYTPGRRWSGLEFDLNGTFYFADYESGDLFALRNTELNNLLSGTMVISSDIELLTTAWLLRKGLKNPYDIELELPFQQTMIVSTIEGWDYFRLPVVGRLNFDPEEMEIVRFATRGKVTFLPDSNNQFIAIPTEEDVSRRTIQFHLRWRDPSTLAEYCFQITRGMSNFGVTILEIKEEESL